MHLTPTPLLLQSCTRQPCKVSVKCRCPYITVSFQDRFDCKENHLNFIAIFPDVKRATFFSLGWIQQYYSQWVVFPEKSLGKMAVVHPKPETEGTNKMNLNSTENFKILLYTLQATRQQSLNYGCIVENKDTHEVTHYVEKPETFVSTSINCGIYLFSPNIFQHIGVAFQKNQEEIR